MKASLAGWTVLVTRPGEPGRALAEGVRERGGTALLKPGVSIEPADADSPGVRALAELERFQALIFTSVPAVSHALAQRPASSWPAQIVCYAVGEATAQALAEAGLRAQLPAEGYDSESLLRLDALQQVRGWLIGLVAAPGGRELLHDELTRRGARVEWLHVYRRCDPEPLTTEQRRMLLQAAPRVMLTATSAVILENITRLARKAGLETAAWHLCALSPRVAERARALGYERVAVAEAPGNDALLACLERSAAIAKN